MSVRTITPTEVEELRRLGRAVDLIDVRTPAEYRELRAEPARLVPLVALDPRAVMEARGASSGEPLYLICRSGSRADRACAKFQAAGFANVVNVEGGTLAWERAGLPVVRGRKTLALERQVQLVVGSLVVLGTALGAFVHPAFLGLPAFMGLGLTCAGLTGACGLGMLLARMPWNRGRLQPPSCAG